MKNSLLAQRSQSRLVIIDMQAKLAGAMHTEAMQAVVKNCGILLKAAALLEIPSFYTEQYPQGLGHTMPELAQLLGGKPGVTKASFSCCAEPAFNLRVTHARL